MEERTNGPSRRDLAVVVAIAAIVLMVFALQARRDEASMRWPQFPTPAALGVPDPPYRIRATSCSAGGGTTMDGVWTYRVHAAKADVEAFFANAEATTPIDPERVGAPQVDPPLLEGVTSYGIGAATVQVTAKRGRTSVHVRRMGVPRPGCGPAACGTVGAPVPPHCKPLTSY